MAATVQSDGEIDYSKSTNAYPMPKEPVPLFVDNSDIDFSKSTGAYPMYDDHVVTASGIEGGVVVEHVVEHLDAPADVQFPTPGPISTGLEDAVTRQRQDLGLSADPTGESDAGYEARPSTVPVPGADGVDRTADAATDSQEPDVPTDPAPAAKSAKKAQTKVVTPPAPASGESQTTASTK